MDIKIFGRPTATIDGHSVSIPAKGYALVAFLSSARNLSAQVQEIRSVLWPQSTEDASGAALRQLSARIRRHTMGIDLAPACGMLRTLEARAASIDVLHLCEILKTVKASTVDGSRAGKIAEQILGLYRGELLEGIEFEGGFEDELVEWISIERSRYRTEVTSALRRMLAAADLERPLATSVADRLIEEDPLDEVAWRYRIKNALAAGERATLEHVFENCSAVYKAHGVTSRQPQELSELKDRLAPTHPLNKGEHFRGPNGEAVRLPQKSSRPILLLTRGTNESGLDLTDVSLYESIASALSKYRTYEIVEFGDAMIPIRETVSEAYAVHVSPRSTSQLGVWLSLVNPQLHGQSARLAGRILWTGILEKSGEARHAVEHQLAQMVGSIVGEIERAERDSFGSGDRATAYRLYLEGQRDVYRVDLAGLRRARSRFREALKIDEAYAPALSGMSRSYLMEWLIRGDPDSNYLQEAWRLARLAISADREDARSIHRLAHVELYRRQFDRSLDLFERAINANPSDLSIRADFADALSHAGKPLQALQVLNDISAIDPLVPENHHWIRGSTEYTLDRFDDAVKTFMNLADPSSAARPLAAALAMGSQRDEAEKYSSVVRENYPSFSVADWIRMVPNRDVVDQDRYASGLVAAGL